METKKFTRKPGGVIFANDITEISLGDKPRMAVNKAGDASNADNVYITSAFDSLTVNVKRDQVIVVDEIAGTNVTYNPNQKSGLEMRDILLALFPDGNSGSTGSGDVDLSDYYTKEEANSTNQTVASYAALAALPIPARVITVKVTADEVNNDGETGLYQKWPDGSIIQIAAQKVN